MLGVDISVSSALNQKRPVLGHNLYPGYFTNIGVGWTDNGDGTYSGNAATGLLYVAADPSHISGTNYRATFTITDYSGGSVAQRRDNTNTLTARSANGTYTEDYVGLDFPWITYEPITAFTGTISIVSDREIY